MKRKHGRKRLEVAEMNYDDARIEMFDAEDMSGGFFSEEEELDLI